MRGPCRMVSVDWRCFPPLIYEDGEARGMDRVEGAWIVWAEVWVEGGGGKSDTVEIKGMGESGGRIGIGRWLHGVKGIG